MMVADPPQTDEERGLEVPVRYELLLTAEDYRALCAEWVRRRNRGVKVTMRAIILEAIRKHLPEPGP